MDKREKEKLKEYIETIIAEFRYWNISMEADMHISNILEEMKKDFDIK